MSPTSWAPRGEVSVHRFPHNFFATGTYVGIAGALVSLAPSTPTLGLEEGHRPRTTGPVGARSTRRVWRTINTPHRHHADCHAGRAIDRAPPCLPQAVTIAQQGCRRDSTGVMLEEDDSASRLGQLRGHHDRVLPRNVRGGTAGALARKA